MKSRMSMWAQAQQLQPHYFQQIKALYTENFPIEVRHFLAQWIEATMWNYMDVDGIPEQPPNIQAFMDSLIQEIHKKADAMNNPDMFVNRMKLTEAAKQLMQRYSHNPWQLFYCIQQCLKKELELLRNLNNVVGQDMPIAEIKYSELIQGLNNVRSSLASTNEEIHRIESQQQSFALHYHECTKTKANLNYLVSKQATEESKKMEIMFTSKVEELERSLTNIVTTNVNAQLLLTDRLMENIDSLSDLQRRVLDEELIRWKREQQLNGNGAVMTTPLNTIQEWCESLADLIWLTRQQVKDAARLASNECFKTPTVPGRLQEMDKTITGILSTLVTSTFVIEKQPPQVMKTNTRFTSTVRLLVGGQLNVYMNPPEVQVIIITESQAQALLKSEASGAMNVPKEVCGEILNNTGTMEYQHSTKQLSVSFRNMQLRKIKRAEKKGTESVMDEKLTLLFRSQFKVGGGELTFHVWTLSLPVVVIVHGNQEPHGWATVTWDNAFAAPGRIPFLVPDKCFGLGPFIQEGAWVAWGQLAETLNLKFNAATGKKLSDANLRFLAEKIFNRSPLPVTDAELNSALVSWAQFCKDALPERTFTFWEWFYMVMKVTREHLRSPWADGLILGFIQKKQAEELLASCPSGTFLLRFSESELGGITIALVHDTPVEGKPVQVLSVQPFTAKDLTLRPLADRVKDLTDLHYLYREDGVYLPKDQAFQKYYNVTVIHPSSNGYVPTTLVTDIARPRTAISPATSPPYQFGSESRDSCKTEVDSILEQMLSPSGHPTLMDVYNMYDAEAPPEFLDTFLQQPMQTSTSPMTMRSEDMQSCGDDSN